MAGYGKLLLCRNFFSSFYSKLYGIDMSNPSLKKLDAFNGHVVTACKSTFVCNSSAGNLTDVVSQTTPGLKNTFFLVASQSLSLLFTQFLLLSQRTTQFYPFTFFSFSFPFFSFLPSCLSLLSPSFHSFFPSSFLGQLSISASILVAPLPRYFVFFLILNQTFTGISFPDLLKG